LKSRNNPAADQEFISASEISKYVFCNVSWYLDKEGAPRNPGSGIRMQRGVQSHSSLKKRHRITQIATYAVILVALVISGYIFISLY
jgi:hypothetical protein